MALASGARLVWGRRLFAALRVGLLSWTRLGPGNFLLDDAGVPYAGLGTVRPLHLHHQQQEQWTAPGLAGMPAAGLPSFAARHIGRAAIRRRRNSHIAYSARAHASKTTGPRSGDVHLD